MTVSQLKRKVERDLRPLWDALEEKNCIVRFDYCDVDKYNSKVNCEVTIETRSPAGEDLPETIVLYEGTRDEVIDALYTHWMDFDEDENVAKWAEFRGTRGVPKSFGELVDDARAIDKIYEGWYNTAKEVLE